MSLVLAVGADCVLGPDCGRGVASWHLVHVARFCVPVPGLGAWLVPRFRLWAQFVSLVLALGADCVLGPGCGRGLCPGSWLRGYCALGSAGSYDMIVIPAGVHDASRGASRGLRCWVDSRLGRLFSLYLV